MANEFLRDQSSLIKLLPDAAYVAINLEVTGDNVNESTNNMFNDDMIPEEKYQILRSIAERYSIIQVGIAVFNENKDFKSHVRKKYKADNEGEDKSTSRPLINAENLSKGSTVSRVFIRRSNSYDESNSDDEEDESYDEMDDTFDDSEHEESDSINEEVEPPEYLVHRYNFFLFPPTDKDRARNRDITLNPSIIASIKSHCDFNKWLKHGTSYVMIDEADSKVKLFCEKHADTDKQLKQTLEDIEDMTQLTHPDDIAFVSRTIASLREWIDSNVNPERQVNNRRLSREAREMRDGVAFQLPACNCFLRKHLCKTIETEYPALSLEQNDGQIRVLRLDSEEKKQRDLEIRREEWHKIHYDYIGFTWVFKALIDAFQGKLKVEQYAYEKVLDRAQSNNNDDDTQECRSKIPLIVHDGLLDLLFLIKHLVSPLPSTWHECKTLLHKYFPIVFDTMVLSSECSDEDVTTGNTNLGDLYYKYCLRFGEFGDLHSDVTVPKVVVVNEANENSIIKEAAYGAFLAGVVFQCLSRRKLEIYLNDGRKTEFWRHAASRKYQSVGSILFLDEFNPYYNIGVLFGRNKLPLQPTMFLADLEPGKQDILIRGMEASFTFRMSGIQSHDLGMLEIEIREVLLSVTQPEDNDSDHLVVHEIYFLSGNICIVGIIWANEVYRYDDQTLEQRKIYAKRVLSALQSLYSHTVITMEDYITSKRKPSTAFHRLVSILQGKKRRLSEQEKNPNSAS